MIKKTPTKEQSEFLLLLDSIRTHSLNHKNGSIKRVKLSLKQLTLFNQILLKKKEFPEYNTNIDIKEYSYNGLEVY